VFEVAQAGICIPATSFGGIEGSTKTTVEVKWPLRRLNHPPGSSCGDKGGESMPNLCAFADIGTELTVFINPNKILTVRPRGSIGGCLIELDDGTSISVTEEAEDVVKKIDRGLGASRSALNDVQPRRI
jgi:hypothetical protein